MRHSHSTIFIVLISFIAQLIVLAILFALPLSSIERFLLVICILLLIVGYYSHFFDSKSASPAQNKLFWGVCVASLASGLTSLLVITLSGNIVLAASLVGTVLGVLPRKRMPFLEKNVQFPGYTGVFVGMSAPSLFAHWAFGLLAGAIAGLLYVWGEHSLGGVGGRLGTFAFMSVCLIVFIQFLVF